MLKILSRRRGAPAKVRDAEAPPPVVKNKTRRRFGINARLMLAFAGVASTTVIASGVAWWSFGRVETTLDNVTHSSLPAISASLSLAEKATGITGAAPRILATKTQEEREAEVAAIQQAVSNARTDLAALAEAGVDPSVIQQIGTNLDQLSDRITALDDLQTRQIDLEESWAEAAAEAGRYHKRFRSAISQVSDDAFYNITMDLGGVGTIHSGMDCSSLKGVPTALSRVFDVQLPVFRTP